MEYGQLHVFVGPMFAGKTESLIEKILFKSYFANPNNQEIGVFKPKFDNRFSDEDIISHDGATVHAKAITGVNEIPSEDLKYAFFDEVQFFGAPFFDGDFMDLVRDLRMRGVDVYCAGLDMDYLGRAFEVSASLITEASSLHRLTARCAHCGGPATHTIRNEMTAERIMLGTHGSYSPMCAQHWFEAKRASVLVDRT